MWPKPISPVCTSPAVFVSAFKDPSGADFDCNQIIKGWIDAKGELKDKACDVVLGDAEKCMPGGDGKVQAVGSTMDVCNSTRTNTIGAPEPPSATEVALRI